MAHALGVRMPYDAIPAPVRGWVERELGSVVTGAVTQHGGFSPGVAARLVTASGRRAFVKAVGPELNPDTPKLFRNEIAVMQGAGSLPQAPTLYAAYDDCDWVGLLLEDVEGRIAHDPWTRTDADRVLAAVAELSEALSSSPWPAAPVAAVRSGPFLTRWDLVAADGIPVPDWVRVPELVELAAVGRTALAAGNGLAHWDVRADNVLLTEDGRVVFIDWAHAATAPAWADTVIVQGDIRGSLELPELPDDPGITGFLAAIAGGLWWASFQPDPPNLPTIRAWQRQAAKTHLRWLRSRLGW